MDVESSVRKDRVDIRIRRDFPFEEQDEYSAQTISIALKESGGDDKKSNLYLDIEYGGIILMSKMIGSRKVK